MVTRFVYPARLEEDEEGFILVTFRDLTEAATNGRTREEALEEAADLLNSGLMFRIKYREQMPLPSRARRGEVMIAPDPEVALKAAVYWALQESGMSIAELSRALEVDYKEAQRIVNPRHPTKLGRMVAALNVLGKRLTLEVGPA